LKKILVPMLEAGAGHKMPALAVKESINRLFPGQFQVDVIDFPREVGALKSDRSIKQFWDIGLANPFLAKTGYRFADSLWPFSIFWNQNVYPEFKQKALTYVREYNPDLIFSTNFITSTMSAAVRKKLALPIEVISYVTDPFDAFGWWVDPDLDFILVASEVGKKQLLSRGIPDSKIRVLPFPIHQKFFTVHEDPDKLRQKLGLRPGLPTMLTTEGGQGIGKISQYVLQLHQMGYPCNIISICGKNEKLFGELQTLVQKNPDAPTHIIPLGFVNNMNELLGLSDLCVAKAGASTMFEALLKGIPIIFSSWASYNEKPNIDFCVSQGIGWYAPDFSSFKNVLDLLFEKHQLAPAKKRIADLGLRSGSDEVAQFLVSRLMNGGANA